MSAPNLQLAANVVRGLSMDAVQQANSGHPGMPMGMADVATTLWLRTLRYSTDDPNWVGRDRFVLSAGHGSMLLYSLLPLAGCEVTLDDIRAFRQLHSRTPGHPEFGMTQGVETTTGPLGQGFANGVGMALAAKMTAARFGTPLLESRVFAIVSDGDLMEGISSEAASLAGHLGLDNLVYLYDDNRITIDGGTDITFSENVAGRFEAVGWNVLAVDGHDCEAIGKAIDAASAERARPTLVICRTHIGKGSPNKQDTSGSHGAPLGADEIALTKAALGLPGETFWIADEVRDAFREAGSAKNAERDRWNTEFAAWQAANPEAAAAYRAFLERETPADLFDRLLDAVGDADGATRALSGKVIQIAAELVSGLVGGSADLDASCKTNIKASGLVERGEYQHRNLAFGIREHAMGSMLNGMALFGGYLPIGSTFLVFADYNRPSIRLASLMGIPVGFVFTHDSLMVGEDGPTHQPVEHAAALRLIPNLHVFRPADGAEVAAAWAHMLERRDGPVAILLTRQGVPRITRPARTDVRRGAHVVREADGAAAATVVATGAEVSVTLEAVEKLATRGIHLRVVSMPCVEVFRAQDAAFREAVLPSSMPTLAVEMGRPEIWCQFTGSLDRVVGLDRFGASAPGEALAKEYGFTADAIAEKLAGMVEKA
ncbi:MAG: transketolase [Planctomycetes bacterium]|nr:transketolase [Planctomycetota bacterium]